MRIRASILQCFLGIGGGGHRFPSLPSGIAGLDARLTSLVAA
jgi:hypothetical protein